MRAEDIVVALQDKLPSLVDDFTDTFSISAISIIYSSPGLSTLQITTSTPHGLSAGKQVFIKNVFEPVQISTFTRNFIEGTVITVQPHDLTKKGNNAASQPTATIQGAVNAEFNGTFPIQSVTSRNEFSVVLGAGTQTDGGGTAMIANDISSSFNNISGLATVTLVPSLTSFQYNVPTEVTIQPVSVDGVVNSNPRISAAASLDQFKASYTKQALAKAWLCVVIGASTANKSRDQSIDATDNIQRTQYFNQKYSTLVDLYVALPTTSNVSGRAQADRCQELIQPICQSILFKKFDSLLTAGKFNPLQITGSTIESYDGATLYFQYSFEQVAQMQFDDTSGYDDDVAFRDIDLTQEFSTGTEELETSINLDD